MALDAWADRGIAPPDSRYPRVENGTLVSLDDYLKSFPRIPGVAVPHALNDLQLLSFGPGFRSEGGHRSALPPTRGKRSTVLVPAVDEEGLEPRRRASVGDPGPSRNQHGVECSRRGPSRRESLWTKTERMAADDPRASLEERYSDHQGYVNAVMHATEELVQEGFLLQEDADRFNRTAEASDVLRRK